MYLVVSRTDEWTQIDHAVPRARPMHVCRRWPDDDRRGKFGMVQVQAYVSTSQVACSTARTLN